MTERGEQRHIMLMKALLQKGSISFKLMHRVIHKEEALTASLPGENSKPLNERFSDPTGSLCF